MDLSRIKERLSSVELMFFALGILLCTIPLQMMTKMAASGLLPSFKGISFTSFEILPLYAIGNTLTNIAFFIISGWWRDIPVTRKLSIPFPKIRWYIFVSGVCTVGQIFTAIWAYTYSGISIVFVTLLMKGGILVLGPLIDVIAKKRKRTIYWPSWIAALLSLAALVIASAGKIESGITLICALDIALYLTVHVIKLSIMSRWAKSKDKKERKQYIIEEQIVIAFVLSAVLILMGIVGSAAQGDSIFMQVWRGYAVLPMQGFISIPLLIGAAAVGMGIFQSLVYLDRRENTFCIAAIQSSGIISGAIVTVLLSKYFDQRQIGMNMVISVIIVIFAIAFLAYRGVVEMRKTNEKSMSKFDFAGGAVGLRKESV